MEPEKLLCMVVAVTVGGGGGNGWAWSPGAEKSGRWGGRVELVGVQRS